MKEKHCKRMGRWIFSFLLAALPFFVSAQSRIVTGKVTDARDNSPLPGVSVQVKGTNTGTVTDAEGNFSISVPSKDARLIFSYSGLGAQEIAVKDQNTIS